MKKSFAIKTCTRVWDGEDAWWSGSIFSDFTERMRLGWRETTTECKPTLKVKTVH